MCAPLGCSAKRLCWRSRTLSRRSDCTSEPSSWSLPNSIKQGLVGLRMEDFQSGSAIPWLRGTAHTFLVGQWVRTFWNFSRQFGSWSSLFVPSWTACSKWCLTWSCFPCQKFRRLLAAEFEVVVTIKVLLKSAFKLPLLFQWFILNSFLLLDGSHRDNKFPIWQRCRGRGGFYMKWKVRSWRCWIAVLGNVSVVVMISTLTLLNFDLNLISFSYFIYDNHAARSLPRSFTDSCDIPARCS